MTDFLKGKTYFMCYPFPGYFPGIRLEFNQDNTAKFTAIDSSGNVVLNSIPMILKYTILSSTSFSIVANQSFSFAETFVSLQDGRFIGVISAQIISPTNKNTLTSVTNTISGKVFKQTSSTTSIPQNAQYINIYAQQSLANMFQLCQYQAVSTYTPTNNANNVAMTMTSRIIQIAPNILCILNSIIIPSDVYFLQTDGSFLGVLTNIKLTQVFPSPLPTPFSPSPSTSVKASPIPPPAPPINFTGQILNINNGTMYWYLDSSNIYMMYTNQGAGYNGTSLVRLLPTAPSYIATSAGFKTTLGSASTFNFVKQDDGSFSAIASGYSYSATIYKPPVTNFLTGKTFNYARNGTPQNPATVTFNADNTTSDTANFPIYIILSATSFIYGNSTYTSNGSGGYSGTMNFILS